MFKSYVLFVVAVCYICQVSGVLGLEENVNRLTCIRDASVNPSLVEKSYNGDISDSRSLKCYFRCYYENAGYMNDKGEIQEDKLRANIPSGINKVMANKAIDLCKNRKGTDPCETAYLTQKCLLDNNLKY